MHRENITVNNPDNNELILRTENLNVAYGSRGGDLPALNNISFSIKRGEIVGVVGESGCGKSTLSYTINGLLSKNGKVTEGSVYFKGEEIISPTVSKVQNLWGDDISMIFQDPMTSLNPVFTIDEQIMNALKAQNSKNNDENIRDRMFKMLERVGIHDGDKRLKEYPHQFSGGMRQRIMIAIALLSEPSLLIADEPTSALDVTLEAQINDLILNLTKEMGTSVLYITHDLGVVAQICDKVMVMYAGEIIECGDVNKIFKNPEHPYTQALLKVHPAKGALKKRLYTIPGRVPSLNNLPEGCRFASRCEYKKDICTVEAPLETGGEINRVRCHFPLDNFGTSESAEEGNSDLKERSREHDNIMIKAENLKVHFPLNSTFIEKVLFKKSGLVKAVNGIDLEIPRGEILALVGESGSGKTTMGRALLRLNNLTEGKISLDGNEISNLSQREIRPMRAKMQMIFQDPISSLSPRRRVSSLLLEPFKIHNQKVDNPHKKVKELLNMVGLSVEQSDKYPHQLSGGQARRVSMARALALNPEILIADEPTAGLDVSVAAGILNLLKDLKDQLGLTYIIITHDLNIIHYTADRVAVMYLGQLVELSEADDFFKQPRHPYSEALLSAVSVPDPELRGKNKRIILEGETPSPSNPPPGCSFHPRCRYSKDICLLEKPDLKVLEGNKKHLIACHFPDAVINSSL